MNNYISTVITLQDIIKNQYKFNVPIYQRLYVWGDEQIKKLLEDLKNAFLEKQTVYYLGGVITIQNLENNSFDLIDGQQRFTTLWLISVVLQKLSRIEGHEFNSGLFSYIAYEENGRNLPRIHFSIRDEVNTYFEILINASTYKLSAPEMAEDLNKALGIIEGFLTENFVDSQQLGEFADFIQQRVELVKTNVPQSVDLNKLFEIINNRGIQLQHHQILKAKLLHYVSDSTKREAYSLMWDACAFMNGYVEYHIRDNAKVDIAQLFKDGKLSDAQMVLQKIESEVNDNNQNAFPLLDILENKVEIYQNTNSKIANELEETPHSKVRSIITFGMLLQHILRIYLFDNNKKDIVKVSDKKLLNIFQESWLISLSNVNKLMAEKEVESFLNLLWQGRYLFDQYIIKWLPDNENEEFFGIRQSYINNTTLSRQTVERKGNSSTMTLLQSMLYHSQEMVTQYWITPFLNCLIKNDIQGFKDDDRLNYLMKFEHSFLNSEYNDTLVRLSHKFLDLKCPLVTVSTNMSEILGRNLGVRFGHYWFYKLEFILWHFYNIGKLKEVIRRNPDSPSIIDSELTKNWKTFQITSKNSVEHITPQNIREYDRNREVIEIDDFGNLVLLSKGMNSSFSNKTYAEKRVHFLERNRADIDSLKSSLIFSNSSLKSWSDEEIKQHCLDMLNIFNAYQNEIEQLR